MCKARFTEHQIIAVLKSVEAGRTVKSAVKQAFLKPAITTGKRSLAGWKPLMQNRA